jgi:WD40 repeat protein
MVFAIILIFIFRQYDIKGGASADNTPAAVRIDDMVNDVAFSSDGAYILVGKQDHTVKLYTIDGIEEQSFNGHRAPVFLYLFLPMHIMY